MTPREYTPTTSVVRSVYVRSLRNAFVESTSGLEAEFDRWLAQITDERPTVDTLRAVLSVWLTRALSIDPGPRSSDLSALRDWIDGGCVGALLMPDGERSDR